MRATSEDLVAEALSRASTQGDPHLMSAVCRLIEEYLTLLGFLGTVKDLIDAPSVTFDLGKALSSARAKAPEGTEL